MKPLEQSGFLISETEDINVATEKNNLGFGILMLMLQTGVCLVYGFLGNIPPNVLNIQSVFITVMHGLLVIAGTSHCYVGFGLLFSYLKKLTWTGLGFTFLITALSIEFYPLFNAFWTRVNIPGYTFQGTPNFTTSTINFNLHLTNAESRNYTFGNTITMAIKCGLACSIGFSSILGRSGFLEATLVALIGGAGFELNRTIIMLYGADLTGTYFIFTYGGFMSLALAVLMKIRQSRNNAPSGLHVEFQANQFSATFAIIGTVIIFVLFPVLAYDYNTNLFIQADFTQYSAPLCMILALGAAAIGGFFMSALFNGKLIIRDIINAPIAGGIAIGASSLFITNPCYAVVVGFSAGFIQVFIQNAVEKPLVQKRGINELLSFSLFGLQGLIGSGFAAGWRAIVGGYSDKVAIDKIILNQSQPIYQFVIGLISAAIGLGIGLIAGLLIYFVTRHQTYEHYTDRTYWILNDKIRQKEDDKVEQNIPVEYNNKAVSFEDGGSIKNQHAEL